MAVLQGLYGTGDFAADMRPRNWREGILMVEPRGDVILTALTSQMKQKPTTDPEYSWWELGFEPRIMTISATTTANTAGSTGTITVDKNGLYCTKGTMLFVAESREVMRVTADSTSDTTINVQRGWGKATGDALAALTAGTAQVTMIGTANAEGSGAPKAQARNPVKRFNYTQIFKTSVDHTNTMLQTESRVGNQVQFDREEAMKRHMLDMERAFLFGVRGEYIDPTEAQPVRTTQGIINYLPNQTYSLGGAGTLSDLDDIMQTLFKYGTNDQRVGLVGNKFISQFNKLILNNTQYHVNVEKVTVYGYDFMKLQTPYGDIMLKSHPLLTTDPFYNNSGWFINMEDIEYRFLKGRDTFVKENVQLPDEDRKKDMFITECGLELHRPEHHAIILGL